MHVRSGHMSLYASCTCLVISRFSENIKSPRTRVTDDCEPRWACWELSPCPLQEYKVLLITKSLLQS